MEDILDLIKTRRNIKSFLPKFVSWEKVARVIDAGRHAPCSGNIQNWKFIVIFEPDQKRQIAEACYQQYEIVQAGVLIVICNEAEKVERYYGERGRTLYSIQNCAAAAENMLLEAHALGLGARWVGGFDENEIKSMLSIPPEVSPQMILALGYAKEVPQKPPKYPLETVVYFHKWRLVLKDPAHYMNDIATILARKASAVKGAVEEKGKQLWGSVKDSSAKKSDSEN